jgi:hypothetical protein
MCFVGEREAGRSRAPILMRCAILVPALLAISAGARAQVPTTVPGDAYLDPEARTLLDLVRQHRASAEDAITAYRTLARERISVGLRVLGRERLLYRREVASRVDWTRGAPARITVVGAREAVPIVYHGVRVPEDLDAEVGDLAFDPGDERLLVGLDQNDVVRSPLLPGSEADYRFSTGDTTTIQLPSGRLIRLIELRAQPRRAAFELISGSFWVDPASGAVAEAVYRPSQPLDVEQQAKRDSSSDDDLKDVPGMLKPITIDVRYVTIEYGLWDLRWWLPRLLALHADASFGRFLRVPVTFERSYSGYRISADTTAGAPAAGADRAAAMPPDTETITDSLAATWGDLARTGWKEECRHRAGLRCTCDRGRCHYFAVTIGADSAALVSSPELPPSIFEAGQTLMTASDVEQIASVVKRLPQPPWQAEPPRLHWGPQAPGLLRYNRVEGLSVGVRADVNLSRAQLDGTLRLGTADLVPEAEIGLTHTGASRTLRLAAYRRLDAVSDDERPFSLGSSLQALLLGIDDGEYYRAAGLELDSRPVASLGTGVTLDWRLFAENQSTAPASTNFSLRHLTQTSYVFPPDIQADPANLVGAAVDARLDRGLDADGGRWGARLRLEAAAGTFDYLRPALQLHTTFPLPGPLLLGLESEAGTSLSALPRQRFWYLGGPGTLRGYPGGAASGPAFWRTRAELATSFPAARLALFSDAGWAGPKAGFTRGRPLVSAGIGASFLDGTIRIDLARALRPPTAWRLYLYLNGLL